MPLLKSEPRHLRLFELHRQTQRADQIAARVEDIDIQQISANEMIRLQKAAARSLQERG